MNFNHISSSFSFRLYHNKIDTSTTGEIISEIQNYECSNDDDDDDDDDYYSSINENIAFNNINNALKIFIHLVMMIALEIASCQSVKTEV